MLKFLNITTFFILGHKTKLFGFQDGQPFGIFKGIIEKY